MAGLYFEEFSVGQVVTTVGRTISEDARRIRDVGARGGEQPRRV